jgi:hypothetical protein
VEGFEMEKFEKGLGNPQTMARVRGCNSGRLLYVGRRSARCVLPMTRGIITLTKQLP